MGQEQTTISQKSKLLILNHEQIDFNAGDTLGQVASAAAAHMGSMLTLLTLP